MTDSWQPPASRVTRLQRTQDQMTPGTLRGRLQQASPVPKRNILEPPEAIPTCHVGPEPPADTPRGRLWFDTDEPVAL